MRRPKFRKSRRATTISEELSQLAKGVSEAVSRANNADLKRSLTALERACESAERSWSGSNLGYHASVYYDGIGPKPPYVQFSPEWGLKESWPVNQPDPGWQIMDQAIASEIILSQAGIGNIGEINAQLTRLRGDLSDLKEQGIGLLATASTQIKDSFLDRKQKQVEEIIIADPRTIAISIARAGPSWSRDSTAVTQGRQIAPHQRLKGVYLSANVVENGLKLLENSLKESAAHLVRSHPSNRDTRPVGTHVFIGHGHSLVWRELKDFISDRLKLPYDEFNRVPVAGITNIARLSEMLDSAAVAFLILTAEDEQLDGEWYARLNVIHEAGLFQGRLGFSKAIVLLEDGCKAFSNIEGLGQIRFGKGKIASAFEEVRRVLEREGLLEI